MSFSAPESRIWSGRVGGDPALMRNPEYTVDHNLGAILRRIFFRSKVETIRTPVPARLVAVGETDVNANSLDGVSWSLGADTVGDEPPGICYSPALHTYLVVSGGYVYLSTDGLSFDPVLVNADWALRGCAWSPTLGLFVVVGNDGVSGNCAIAISADGITWTSTGGFASGMSKVIWAEGLGVFCALGTDGATPVTTVSTDGVAWASPTTVPAFNGLAYSPSLMLFVAVGDAGINATSLDGLLWVANAPLAGTPVVRAVCWSETLGYFVAVGEAGKTFVSNDGLSWTENASGFGSDFYAVIYSERLGVYVAVGGPGGGIYTSNDGTVWTDVSLGSGRLYSVADGELYDVISYAEPPLINVIHVSTKRQAASVQFSPGVFSPGVIPAAGGPSVVDEPLELNWSLAPGDVVKVEPEYPAAVHVDFVADMIQEPGES